MKKLSYLVLFFLLAIPASAQNQFKLSSIPFLLSWHNTSKSFQMTDINKRISTIPHNLIIHNHPVDYEIEKDRISITAAGKTNLFNSPSGKSKVANAPLILFEPEADFTILQHRGLKSCPSVCSCVCVMMSGRNSVMRTRFIFSRQLFPLSPVLSLMTATPCRQAITHIWQ